MAKYELDNVDAARLVETLIAVADLVEQPPGSGGYLSDGQLRCLTCPPGLAIAKDRPAFAKNLRASAAALAKQLLDDAPDVSGPYAYWQDASDILGSPPVPRFAANANFLAGRDRAQPGQDQLPVQRLRIQLPLTASPRHQHAPHLSRACCEEQQNPSAAPGSVFTCRRQTRRRPLGHTPSSDSRSWSSSTHAWR